MVRAVPRRAVPRRSGSGAGPRARDAFHTLTIEVASWRLAGFPAEMRASGPRSSWLGRTLVFAPGYSPRPLRGWRFRQGSTGGEATLEGFTKRPRTPVSGP